MSAETKTIQIKQYSENTGPDWDRYVAESERGSFLHLSGWKNVLEKTFGYKPFYIYAESEGRISGILPLFLITNILSGRALVSLPFGIYGGAITNDAETERRLIEEAKQIMKKESAAYMELRNIVPIDNMPTKDLYATFVKELPDKAGDCLEKLPRKARASARKGVNSGLTIEVGAHHLKTFYDIYAISVRNLGTPVFSYGYLENMVREFKEKVHVLIVKHEKKPIAGVLSFLHKSTIMPYYGGALQEFFKYQPNNFMYLKLMEWAVENGYRYFDFGRSKKGTGSYKFKELQGFEARPLHYQYCFNTISEIPDTSSMSPKVKFVSSLWKKLPVWVTKLVGPKVIGLTPP